MCRYYLQTGAAAVDPSSGSCIECSELIANLPDLKVSFTRSGSEAGGVVRKSTSQIAFIGAAREAILEEYRRNQLTATAAFAVYTADGRWEYTEDFSCPLDFSSLQFDSYSLKINCIDNSAEALLKANKGTSYEYAVSGLREGTRLGYDRVLVANDWKWEPIADTIDGSSTTKREFKAERHTASLIIDGSFSGRVWGYVTHRAWFPYVGQIDGNVPRNTSIELLDQEENTFTSAFAPLAGDNIPPGYDPHKFPPAVAWKSPETGIARALKECHVRVDLSKLSCGFDTLADAAASPVGLYRMAFHLCVRHKDSATPEEVPGITTDNSLNMVIGGGVGKPDRPQSLAGTDYKGTVHLVEGDLLQFYIDVDSSANCMGTFSALIVSPAITATWNERGDTIEVDVVKPETLLNRMLQSIGGEKMRLTGVLSPTVGGEPNWRLARTRLIAAESLRGFPGAKVKSSFSDFCEFMAAEYGYVYGVEEDNAHTSATVTFRHRSEYYRNEVVKTLSPISEPSYKVDSASIYSNVQVGYTRQDYDSGNTGYDEFNFSCSYTTGITAKEKKLEVMCPYRADCYGIEEAVNKGTDSTGSQSGEDSEESTSSDNDVFLVMVAEGLSGGLYVPDRSIAVTGVFSSTVFNAALSPPYMIAANESYIGSFCDRLSYVSSTGNSSAVIGGEPLKRDIDLGARLMRPATLTVATDDPDLPATWDGLIAFEWDGLEYRGYVDNLDVKRHRPEALEYQLIEAGEGSAGADAYAFDVEPETLSFTAGGGTGRFTVVSTRNGEALPFTASTPPGWLTLSALGGTATCTANTGNSAREGTVTFTQERSGRRATLRVVQAGKGYVFKAESGTVEFPANAPGWHSLTALGVTSTLDGAPATYEIARNTLPGWLHGANPDRTQAGGSPQLAIDANGTGNVREADIRLVQLKSAKVLTLTIRQLS